MDLYVKWYRPLKLIDNGSDYEIKGLDEWAGYPGVYMFCRLFDGELNPLYIGKAENVYTRVKQQLNNLKLIRGIENAPNGEKVLVIGEFQGKSGQHLDKSLRIIESALIDHAINEGHELLNIQGVNAPTNTINFSGFRMAKDFTKPTQWVPAS